MFLWTYNNNRIDVETYNGHIDVETYNNDRIDVEMITSKILHQSRLFYTCTWRTDNDP